MPRRPERADRENRRGTLERPPLSIQKAIRVSDRLRRALFSGAGFLLLLIIVTLTAVGPVAGQVTVTILSQSPTSPREFERPFRYRGRCGTFAHEP